MITIMLYNFCVLFLAVAVTPSFAKRVPSIQGGTINGVQYFTHTSVPRTRAQALAYCVSQGGELAKVNGSLFRLLQIITPTIGSYWIDGIDKTGAERFRIERDCTWGILDFVGIPGENLDIPVSSCLSYNRGSTSALSKIQAISCEAELTGVLCSTPVDGCSVWICNWPSPWTCPPKFEVSPLQ